MVETGSGDKREDVARYLKLLSYSKVREKIIDALSDRSPPIERVPIDAALNRVSAETVVAPCDVPAVSTSSMDGYVVRSVEIGKADISHPILLNVKGALYPGSRKPTSRLKGLETYYVGTGAPVPSGGDAVVRVEETRSVDGRIAVSRRIPEWKNITLQGEDIRAGTAVIKKGGIVNAADVALLITVGRSDLSVFRTPRIGILSTGDELTSFGSEEAGKKVNNYSNLIAAYLTDAGATPLPLGVARDNRDEILNEVERNIEDLDALVTIGGSSVGKQDLTPAALKLAHDNVEVFHGIRLVPVRPTGLFIIKGKPVILLPGHSVAASLSFFLVVKPIVNILSGLKFDSRTPVLRASLSERAANPRPIGCLFLAKLAINNGNYMATPLRWGSNLISSLAGANAFLQLGPGETLEAGRAVTVTLLGIREISRVSSRDAR